jgi:hypothetical protein
MTIPVFVTMLAVTMFCMRMAQQMAAYQQRSVRFWLWCGALAGPVAPMVLAALPRRIKR